MRLGLLFTDLGMSSYVPQRKEWISAAIGVVGGLASSLFGGGAAAAAAERAEQRQRNEEAKENAYYNRRYNEDYVDTKAGQNLVRRAKGIYDSQIKRAIGAEAVGGGTNAATQMAKDSANRAVGETIADISAEDTRRRELADAQHREAQSRFAQMDMNREMQRAQSITNAAQQASNALMSAGAAVDQASAAKTSLGGGGNNSIAFNPPEIKSSAPVSPAEMYQNATAAEQEHFRNKIFQ